MPPPAAPPGGVPGGIPPVGPVHVPSLDVTEGAELIEQLRDWVAQLARRFDLDSRVIPPCWERHNGMVEALAALRDLERDCYAENAPPAAAVDWFRGLREIETRLVELASLTNCSRAEHRSPLRGWASQPADPDSQRSLTAPASPLPT
ncbi:MAG: hypothetical protein L0H26_08240 [Microlunatus sp.]|nr:hypothetical protein [Microlunatus sp.]